MVATDVASRGIGMIDIPSPSLALHAITRLRFSGARLCKDSMLYDLRIMPGLFRDSRFFITGNLGLMCSAFFATLVFRSLFFLLKYRAGLASLVLFKMLSPRLPIRKPGFVNHLPRLVSSQTLKQSMQEEYWTH